MNWLPSGNSWATSLPSASALDRLALICMAIQTLTNTDSVSHFRKLANKAMANANGRPTMNLVEVA